MTTSDPSTRKTDNAPAQPTAGILPDIRIADTLDDKTRQILDAATRLFLQHGFNATSTDMIQREAGVSKATLYGRYPTKEALFIAVIGWECAYLTAEVNAIDIRRDTLTATLTRVGHAYLQLVLKPEALALLRVVVAETGRFPELGKVFYQAGPAVIGRKIASLLEQAAQQGELDLSSMGADSAAGLFTSLLRGEAQMQCLTHTDSRPSDIQIERWVTLAVQTLLRAYGRQPDH